MSEIEKKLYKNIQTLKNVWNSKQILRILKMGKSPKKYNSLRIAS